MRSSRRASASCRSLPSLAQPLPVPPEGDRRTFRAPRSRRYRDTPAALRALLWLRRLCLRQRCGEGFKRVNLICSVTMAADYWNRTVTPSDSRRRFQHEELPGARDAFEFVLASILEVEA